LNPVFRQNVELLQAVQALAQFCLAQANPFLPAAQVTHRLKDVSRQIPFANESFKIGKFTFKAAQVSAAVGNQIDGNHPPPGTVSPHLHRGSAGPLKSQERAGSHEEPAKPGAGFARFVKGAHGCPLYSYEHVIDRPCQPTLAGFEKPKTSIQQAL
jgi:hypothetical protein